MMKKFKIKEEMAVNTGGVGEYSTPKAFKKYRIKEIKVNKPDLANTILDLLIELGDKIDLGWYFSKFNISEDGNGPLDNIRNSPRENQLALYNYLKNKYINENHLPEPKDFPIKISSYEQAQLVGQWLQKYGYKIDVNQPPFNVGKGKFLPFIINNDGTTSQIQNGIKINKPGELPLDKHDVEFEKLFLQVEKEHPNEYPRVQWIITNKLFKKKFGVGVGEKKLNESKYSQFKQSTSKPNPKQILHKAIKEIQLKLDEVNKLIDFTSRIKGELTEGDQEIEYLNSNKDNINKIQNRLKEVFNKLCELDEIRVNNPTIKFPIEIKSQEEYNKISTILDKNGYFWEGNEEISSYNPTKRSELPDLRYPFYIFNDGIDKIITWDVTLEPPELDEIKVNNPLLTFDDLMKQGLYGNANRTIAVFKQMGFTMNDYGKGLEGFFKELSQEDKIKMMGIAKKMNK